MVTDQQRQEARLIQLPSGDWIRPEDVRHVRALEAFPGNDSLRWDPILPRVVVETTAGACFVTECVSMPAAIELRDKVAREVNA